MNNLNLDWNNLGFDYRQTSKRYVSNYENNSWDEGNLTEDANVVINECAGVLQYAQTCFEGLKAYRRKEGKIVLGQTLMLSVWKNHQKDYICQ